MGPRKSRCDIPSGTTQGQDYPPPNFKFQVFFHSQVPIEILHVSKNVVFYDLDNSYVDERCCHVEIIKIIDVSCHDLNQSLSSDVGADADIVDMLFFP
jgi:hypothetical protein